MPHLRLLRHSRGLRIIEVAQQSGLSARALIELEYGLRPLDHAARLALARSYDLAPEDLHAQLAGPIPQSHQYQGKQLFQLLIHAALLSALMVTPRLGRTLARPQPYTSASSERLVAQGEALEQPSSERYLLASTAGSHRTPASTRPRHAMEREIPIVSPRMPPTSVSHPIPGAAYQPRLAEPSGPTWGDVSRPGGGIASQENAVFMPLPAGGSFRLNVVAALKANNDALQHIVIPPKGTWSFNRAIGDPERLTLVSINGVYGGGWCDLASRYIMVLRPFLPPESFEFIRHTDATGFGLQGVPDEDAAVIWNSNGGADEQDLRIHNTSGRTISIDAVLVADGVQFEATDQ